MSEDERILRELQAELLAKIGGGLNCGPFMAAVYDRNGNCLVETVNTVVDANCSHNHAEMNAIRLVEEKLGSWDLAPRNLVLYATSEPCMMCMGGILWSGIRKVVYGVPSDRVESLAGFDEGFKPGWKAEFGRRGIEVVGPLAVEEGEKVFHEYMRLQKTVYVPKRIGQEDATCEVREVHPLYRGGQGAYRSVRRSPSSRPVSDGIWYNTGMKNLMLAVGLAAVAMGASAGTNTVEATIETSLGTIELELDAAKAPLTVTNFMAYAKAGHYDGTVFHRVIDGFMIQGGGFTSEMRQKETRAPIRNEAANGLKNTRGTIAMARTQIVDSATSQFFINLKDNGFLDYRGPHPQTFGYAVFGHVTKGMEVVDKIAKVQTGNRGFHQNVPVEPVVIKKVSVK